MKKFIAEFKEFISQGNVLDLAVGVMIGGAFSAIVTALCDKIITPLINLIIGTIAGQSIEEMTSALKFGPEADPIDVGAFIAAVINFILMALIIFLIVKGFNKLRNLRKKEEEEEEAATTKKCPFCCSEIDIEATKCPHCTSDIPE